MAILEPSINTDRLRLRPFRDSDAPRLQTLLAEWDVARMTGVIPHPYAEGEALKWFASQREKSLAGTDFTLCIEHDGACVGGMGLHRSGCAMGENDQRTTIEIGYWIGKPFWGWGFATEAARAMIAFAFEYLQQQKIAAGYFADNPKSGQVLAKLGFVQVGTGRHSCVARGCEVDNIAMALSRDAWLAKKV